MTDGVITSVKNPEDTFSRVITPLRDVNKSAKIIATRWTVFAKNDDEAWEALKSQRGLRSPNRDTEIDPAELRKQADALPREEILSKYTIVKSAEDYIEAYTPLIKEVKADIVVIQTTSVNQESTIRFVGEKVLPEL